MIESQHTPRKVIILGALSSIAEATARLYAAQGATLVLAGRNALRLEQVGADLKVRGAKACTPWPIDLAKVEDPAGELSRMVEALGGEADAVFIFYGVLGSQEKAASDMQELREILNVNFMSAASWCQAAALLLERQRKGVLLGISSVAGDRGRQSNYVYGAAKAGLTVFLQGIAHRLAASGARAVVVKLGFVDTAMTAHIQKSGPLWAKPETIAALLLAAAEKPTRPVIYLPWFWRPIMSVIRNVPASIFHKTKL